MNIVFFSPMEIFPIAGGSPNRIFHLAKTISDMGENVYLILNSRNKGSRKIDNLNILSCPIVRSNLPKVSYIFNGLNLLREFKKIDRKIDIIQCEFPYIFPWVYLAKKLRGNPPIVLDQHGVEINFIRGVRFAKPNMFVKIKVFLEEVTAVKLSSHIFSCSKVDAEQISKIYRVPQRKITEIPNAVNPGFFEEIDSYRFEKPTILFLGGFKHPPNYYGAKVVNDVIIPQVIQKRKDAQFIFIGEEPPSWLGNIEHVKVLGYVSDVRQFIRGADICISPIFQGSGTRLKILEYMALGKPVISTSKGAEGIEVLNNENIIIENDMQRFSDHIVDLLGDTAKANRLGANAKKLIEEKYTWEKGCKRAINIYQKLCERRP